MITSLGINLMGDWLRDVLDPRMRRVKKKGGTPANASNP
jgi:hypothetical protein